MQMLPPSFTTAWRTFPYSTRAESHVFAIGDVHGRADLLELLLAKIGEAPPVLGLARKIVLTGDYIDRGPQNHRAIKLAMTADVMLPGNHEAMLLEGLNREDDPRHMLILWLRNGGYMVMDELVPNWMEILEREEDIRPLIRAALPAGFEARMLEAPSHHRDGDLLFVHAGLHPFIETDVFLAQHLFDGTKEEEHWAWIRDDFLPWTGGWDRTGDDEAPGPTVVVHGHTICTNRAFETSRIEERTAEDMAFKAMDRTGPNKRICLDVGAYALHQLAALEVVGDRYRFHVVRA